MFLRILLLGALVGGGLGGYWYGWPREAQSYEVREGVIAREIVAPSVLTANRQVMITAKTPGFLSGVKVDRNDLVREGQSLASLESAELRHQLDAAEANGKAAEFSIREAEVERDRAATAMSLAQDDFGRQQKLFSGSTISSAAFDVAANNLQNAKAALLKAEAAIEQARARAAAAAAEAAALGARIAETDIRSPIDGIVVGRNKTIGDLLAPGAELFDVVDPKSIVASARFDESTIALVKQGQPAVVSFTALDGDSLSGKVLRVTREVDPETREYNAEIVLEKLPESWAIGQRATVTVRTESARKAIAVPQKFVSRRDGRPGVWVLKEWRARWRPVELGYVNGTDIEIRRGLSAGDVIVHPAGRYEWQPIREAQAAP